MTDDIRPLIHQGLHHPEDSWSIGSFGAIGEFHQTAGETVLASSEEDLLRVTERGGIRINSDTLENLKMICFETLSPDPRRWGQGAVFCLPEETGTGSQRDVLTSLGPDAKALLEKDRSAYLFDLGLAQTQIDFCVRTADPDLINLLNKQTGRSLFDSDNPAMGAILDKHPHRIVQSRAGRVEIYQKIGGPDTGGQSPEGPHTHVLPKLLKSGRTHSANIPVPTGFLPVLSYHPASPVSDSLGKGTPFNPDHHTRFQSLLEYYAPPSYWAIRQSVLRAIGQNDKPHDILPPASRLERISVRNTLRQLGRIAEHRNDSKLAGKLHRWRVVYDRQILEGDIIDESENQF